MVDSISKSAPRGLITALMRKKKHQRLHRSEYSWVYKNKIKSLASLDDQHSDNLFPDNKDHKETPPYNQDLSIWRFCILRKKDPTYPLYPIFRSYTKEYTCFHNAYLFQQFEQASLFHWEIFVVSFLKKKLKKK